MNNIFVYCEIEDGKVADVSLELLTKVGGLADTLGCELEALALGHNLAGIERELAEYGGDRVHFADLVLIHNWSGRRIYRRLSRMRTE